MIEKLKQLQHEIYKYSLNNDNEYIVNYSPKLSFFQVNEFLDITFFGEGFDDDPNTKISEIDYETNFAYCSLIDLLCIQEFANKLISIDFNGPDQGANGTNSWDFNRLINSNSTFPNLKSFTVKLTDLGDHNQSIIDGDGMDENGMIAKLLLKMPSLEQLIIPSAPDNSFFEIGEHPLKSLRLQAGYSHQNFIENLAKSENFKQLSTLDYTDLIDVYDIPDEDYTSFESFVKLFNSKAFSTVGHFKLRNANLDNEQLFKLQSLNEVQFLNIKANGGRYVSHLMKEKK